MNSSRFFLTAAKRHADDGRSRHRQQRAPKRGIAVIPGLRQIDIALGDRRCLNKFPVRNECHVSGIIGVFHGGRNRVFLKSLENPLAAFNLYDRLRRRDGRYVLLVPIIIRVGGQQIHHLVGQPFAVRNAVKFVFGIEFLEHPLNIAV